MRKFNRDDGNKSGRRDSGRFGRSSGRSDRRDSGRFGRSSGRSDRRDSDRSDRRDSSRSGFKTEMYRVTCDKCGESCEVPFKPTSNKPIFCSNCFKKEDGPRESQSRYGSSRRNSGPRSERRQESSYGGSRGRSRPKRESYEPRQESDKDAEFKKINAKLDKILEMLNKD